jgi:hypothetical protein
MAKAWREARDNALPTYREAFRIMREHPEDQRRPDLSRAGARDPVASIAAQEVTMAMAPYVMFVDFMPIGGSVRQRSGPVLLKGDTEKDAADEAIAKADSLYPEHATDVLIQVVGGQLDDGRPFEIRRPRSD